MCCRRTLARHDTTPIQRGQQAQPQQFVAAAETIQQVPPPPVFTPRLPTTEFVPTPRDIIGAAGLGDATAALRAYPDAYRAIRSNASALTAVQNNNATREQQNAVERVTAQHGRAIQTFAAIEQQSPGAIQQAARGLAGLIEQAPPKKFGGVSKWSRERDDAAE